MAEERVKRKLAAILVADVVGYSKLMGLDEEGTLATLTSHRSEHIEPRISEHRGRVVKTTGDGLLVEFASIVDAVRCAVVLQEGMRERNTNTPEDRRIQFRIGVNLGDVIVQDDDVFGDGVNVAARLEGLAEPGGVVVSGAAHEMIRSKVGFDFDDLGPQKMKNIAEPVRAFRVRAEGQPSGSQPLPLPDKPSIAVLPFDNMSGDPEQEYFSDGITEDIITALSKLPSLFVIARNSSFAYKGRPTNVKEICRDLGVQNLLEGSVRKDGNRVRITAQLVDGLSGGHLWAERYDRGLDDIFAVQDEVTANIVDALQLRLSPRERQRVAQRVPANLEAYDLYLKARELTFRLSKEANAHELALHEEAYSLDPSYGEAMVGAATCHLKSVSQVWSKDPMASLARASTLIERALALDASLAQAHVMRGYALVWQRSHDEALQSFKTGINLDPNNAFAHGFHAMALNFAGRPREGLQEAELALRLDPHPNAMHSEYYFQMGVARLHIGDYHEAHAALERPPLFIPEFMAPHVLQAAVCVKLGRIDEARVEVSKVRELNPSVTIDWVKQTLPYKVPADLAMMVDALRAAGLPE